MHEGHRRLKEAFEKTSILNQQENTEMSTTTSSAQISATEVKKAIYIYFFLLLF